MSEEKHYPNVRIETDATNGICSRIYIDGHEIEGVRGYKLEHDACGMPTLTLNLNALDVSVDTKRVKLQHVGREGQHMNIKFIDE